MLALVLWGPGRRAELSLGDRSSERREPSPFAHKNALGQLVDIWPHMLFFVRTTGLCLRLGVFKPSTNTTYQPNEFGQVTEPLWAYNSICEIRYNSIYFAGLLCVFSEVLHMKTSNKNLFHRGRPLQSLMNRCTVGWMDGQMEIILSKTNDWGGNQDGRVVGPEAHLLPQIKPTTY